MHAQQNYVLMLADKRGLSSCLQKKNFRTLLGLFTALSFYENHVNTTKTLGKGQKLECMGLLIRVLNILLFIEIDVQLNHGN